jgi:hypothetical protein
MAGGWVSRNTVRIGVRWLVLDAALVVLQRYEWKHSWGASLTFGAVVLVPGVVLVVYSVWWEQNPAVQARLRVKKAERDRRRRRS